MFASTMRLLSATACAALLTAMAWGRPMIIAHRGSSATAPENTVAAYLLAWEQGADAAETDVWMTRDEQVVCLHDSTLKRTAGLDRPVKEVTLEEIAKLDAGSWRSGRFAGEKVPLLADVLATIPEGRRFFLEIKDGPAIVPHVKRIVEESGKGDRITIICFDQDVLDAVRASMPDQPTMWLLGAEKDETTGRYLPIEPRFVQAAKDAGYTALNVSWRGATKELAEAARAAGQELYVWTVDDAAEARRLADMGVAGITTNKPDVMLAAFGATADADKPPQVLHERYTGTKKSSLPAPSGGKVVREAPGTTLSAPPMPGMVQHESYTVSGPGAGVITGKVTRSDGGEVKEVLFGNRAAENPTVIMLNRLPLGEGGSFRASIRPTVTDYIFAATAPQMAPVIVGPFKGDDAALKAPLELRLTPGFEARVRLVSEQKTPVRGATVEAGYGNTTLPALPLETIVTVKSDENGEVVLPHTTKDVARRLKITTAEGQSYTIVIDCQEGVVDEVELAAPQSDTSGS